MEYPQNCGLLEETTTTDGDYEMSDGPSDRHTHTPDSELEETDSTDELSTLQTTCAAVHRQTARRRDHSRTL